eukprot:10598219-Lingulodinium_polyedra.AAC.1
MDQDAGSGDRNDRGGGRPASSGLSRPGNAAGQPSGHSGVARAPAPSAVQGAGRGVRPPQRAGTGAGSSRDGVEP